jgi:RsiW-degrading membrane proteinase PrsW (M82 family)
VRILDDPSLDRLLLGSPLRRPAVARRVIRLLAIALLLSLAVILLVTFSMNAEAVAIFGQALVAAAILSIVPIALLRFLDRRERESPWLFAIAILWGALIATGLALPLNTWIIGAVSRWLAGNQQVAEYLGPRGALLIGAPLAGPLVEEVTKAIGVVLLLWFMRAEFDNVRDGFVYGALVGVGFNLLEAPLYVAQGFAEYGVAPWGLQMGARFALFGLAGHAMFTGIFGAFLGAARQTGRRWLRVLLPLVGLLLAILAHALNNSLGLLITILLRSAGEPLPEPGPPPQIPFAQAWLQTSLQNLIIFLPFVLLLLIVLWRSGRQERRVIAEELAGEVGGPVTADEYAAIRGDRLFHTRRIDRLDRRRSAALVNAQHELAFRKRAVRRDGGDVEADPLVADWRREIDVLRA